MSTPTESVVVREWQAEAEGGRDPHQWPYPTRYQESVITGGLADAVRERLGAPPTEDVYITEAVISGGYSEWTQENDYEFTLTVGGRDVQLPSGWEDNAIVCLTRWLDEV